MYIQFNGVTPYLLFTLEDTGDATNFMLNNYDGTSYLANGLTQNLSLKDCVKIEITFTNNNNNVKPYTSLFAIQKH